MCILGYYRINNKLPSSIKNIIELRKSASDRLSRQNKNIDIPYCKNKFNQRKLAYQIALAWNELPKVIKTQNNENKFKASLKKQLMK